MTDPKPSIRKLAVDVIVDLTSLYIEKFEISSDEEGWDEKYQICQRNLARTEKLTSSILQLFEGFEKKMRDELSRQREDASAFD